MAEPEQVLYTRLTTFAGLTALVGARVYDDRAPQNPTTPYITVQRVGGLREHGMTSDFALAYPVLQLDIYADTAASRAAVARQVQSALLRHQNLAADPAIFDIVPENEGINQYEYDVQKYRQSRDWRMTVRDS